MSEAGTDARVVLTTTATIEDARALGRALVEEGLAACATLVPAAESIYKWEGKVESAGEVLLLLKTVASQLAVLESRLLALHRYDTPEFLVLPVDGGSEGYLGWLHSSLAAAE